MASDAPAPGFPAGVSLTPVPSPLLGQYLAEIADAAELRVTLRFVWLAGQKRGVPRPVRLAELIADRVIADSLGLGGDELAPAVEAAVAAAVARGTLAEYPAPDHDRQFVLNTEPERRAIARMKTASELSAAAGANAAGAPVGGAARVPAPFGTPEPAHAGVTSVPNIYVLYEQNIGALTPMAGQLLQQAAMSFPEEWIREAIGIAVANNARSWKYVAAILERWASEGKAREQPGRDLQEDRLEPYRRAYGRYIKRR